MKGETAIQLGKSKDGKLSVMAFVQDLDDMNEAYRVKMAIVAAVEAALEVGPLQPGGRG